MLMNSSKLAARSEVQEDLEADKGSPGSKGSTISSDREDPAGPDRATRSEIYLKNSRKCSVEADRGAHRGDHSNRLRVKTLL